MKDSVVIRKKICFILMLMSCSLCLCFMSSTYSRYVTGTQGNVDMLLARWQILINDHDIQDNNNSEIEITPTIEISNNVRNNVVAPTSKGYFDIDIDPSNVDVSFQYTITLEIDNENIPDLIISKYAILPEDYEEGDTLEYTTIQNNTITNTMLFDNETTNFHYDAFTIRIYFEWFDGENEEMNNDDDNVIGSEQNASFTITASISFEQILDVEEENNNNDNTSNTDDNLEDDENS